jgi:two-component system chemotaxis response regulator CheB
VLAVREEGRKGHLAFSCRVGHSFSGESLLEAKEEQLEDSLWASVEVFEEIVILHQELGARARANDAAHIALAYERRVKRAEALMKTLRGIISQDGPASADRKKG